MKYQVITDSGNATYEDKAPISLGSLLAASEIVNGEFESVHVADQVNVNDRHARFGRPGKGILGHK